MCRTRKLIALYYSVHAMPNNNNNQIARHKWRTRSGTRAKKKTLFFSSSQCLRNCICRRFSVCCLPRSLALVSSELYSVFYSCCCCCCFFLLRVTGHKYKTTHLFHALVALCSNVSQELCALRLGHWVHRIFTEIFVECIHFGGRSNLMVVFSCTQNSYRSTLLVYMPLV